MFPGFTEPSIDVINGLNLTFQYFTWGQLSLLHLQGEALVPHLLVKNTSIKINVGQRVGSHLTLLDIVLQTL